MRLWLLWRKSWSCMNLCKMRDGRRSFSPLLRRERVRLLDLFPGLCTNEPWLVDALSLAMILASHCLPLVPTSKLNALPLHVRASHLVFNCKSQPRRQILGHHLRCCILSAFQSASFLDLLPTSITQKDG